MLSVLKTNRERVVMQSVAGKVSAPAFRSHYRVDFEGKGRVVPGTGAITYNVRVGDPAFGWAGDHIEPAVSAKMKDSRDENNGFNLLACVGNEARVTSGEAKGETGVVTGKHGGIEHVLIDFPPGVMENMVIGDKILIKAWGQGLALTDFPSVKLMNLSPDLLEVMNIRVKDDRLQVPVVAELPPEIMGSGIGSPSAVTGDYDITTQDPSLVDELGLSSLRLGDFVAINDRSSFYGRSYRRGSIEIGIVVHSDSFLSGHGPGVTTLLTANDGEIEPVVVDDANIATYLDLREESGSGD